MLFEIINVFELLEKATEIIRIWKKTKVQRDDLLRIYITKPKLMTFYVINLDFFSNLKLILVIISNIRLLRVNSEKNYIITFD